MDARYKGVGPAPLVDKIWDLEYVGTCCPEEFYKRLPHVCAWLHDTDIKVWPQEDPTGVKRKMEDSNDESDTKISSKKTKKVDNWIKPSRRAKHPTIKAKLCKLRMIVKAPEKEVGPSNVQKSKKASNRGIQYHDHLKV